MALHYLQTFGRPHSGLENPEKYGLTLREVVSLIDTGKWQAFYNAWTQRQQIIRRMKVFDCVCPSCGKVRTNPNDWMVTQPRCKDCSYKRRTQKKKKRPEKKKVQPTNCHLCGNTTYKLYAHNSGVGMCKQCKNTLEKGYEKRAKDSVRRGSRALQGASSSNRKT